jgi:hypothetical protein
MLTFAADPIPSAQLHVQGPGFKSLYILNKNYLKLTNLQVVTIKKFHLPEVCHKCHFFLVYKFMVLQVALRQLLWRLVWLHYSDNWTPFSSRRELCYLQRICKQVGSHYPLQFVAVNRDNVTDIVSVHTDVWAVNVMALYRILTVITFNYTTGLRRLIYIALNLLDWQKSQTSRAPIYWLYHRNIDYIITFKLNYIMKDVFLFA